MKQQESSLQVCLNTPKFGTVGFFLFMMIIIPISLIYTDNLDILKYYLPFTVLFASTLTSAGAPNSFNDLYPLFPTTVMGFLSANLINFIALIGILWIAVGISVENNNRELGVVIALILIVITFPVATQLIPFFIRQGDLFLKRKVAAGVQFPGNWHKYFLGMTMIVIIIAIEILLIGLLTSEL